MSNFPSFNESTVSDHCPDLLILQGLQIDHFILSFFILLLVKMSYKIS